MNLIRKFLNLRSVFQTGVFDAEDWREVSEKEIPKLQDLNREAAQIYGGNPVQDLFLSLYKRSPQLLDRVDPDLSPLKRFFEILVEVPGFRSLRETVGQDKILAGIAASNYGEVFENIPEELKEAMKDARQKGESLQTKRRQYESLSELLGEVTDKPEKMQQIQQEIENLSEEISATEKAFVEAMENLNHTLDNPKIKGMVKLAGVNAANDAKEEVKSTVSLARGFDLAAGGNPQRVDPESIRAVKELVTKFPEFARIKDYLGRLKPIVNAQESKSPHGRSYMTGFFRRSLDFTSLASSELVRWASGSPVLQTDFLIRLAQGELLHKKFEQEPQGRGPIIVCRDESGSMEGPKHALAVAIEWALAEACRRESRGFTSICFSGPGQMREWTMPDHYDPEPLLHHLSVFYGEGTEPEQAIRRALEIATEKQDQGPDILILTDGYHNPLSSDLLNRIRNTKTHLGLRIYVVVVGEGNIDTARDYADGIYRASMGDIQNLFSKII